MSILWKIFLSFAKIGLVGYGGGPAMIPLIQGEVVDARHWMNLQEFVDLLAMANTLPGPIAPKLAAFVGYKQAGLVGSVVGAVSIVLPAVVLILVMSIFFMQFKDSARSVGALKAVRPAVVALLFYTIYSIWGKSVHGVGGVLIGAVAFVLTAFLDVHPALVILGAALFGALLL